MRLGVRLALDPGDARIGVARCDGLGILATPVETIARGEGDLSRLRDLVEEWAPVELVMGLPKSLSGAEGPAAQKTRVFADEVARAVAPTPVRLVDERMTTVSAEAALRSAGKHGKARRAVVDQAAAVFILQHTLDSERATGVAPGELVGIADD